MVYRGAERCDFEATSSSNQKDDCSFSSKSSRRLIFALDGRIVDSLDEKLGASELLKIEN